MIITLITRPRAVPGVGYVGGQVGIWRVWDEYVAKRRSWKNDPINPNGPRIIAHEKDVTFWNNNLKIVFLIFR